MSLQAKGASLAGAVNRGLLVDSNLLLLFLVGDIDLDFIKQFERTRNYEVSDFDALKTVFDAFEGRIVTTPHILAEVSNLANKLKGDRRARFFSKFSFWIELLEEVAIPGVKVCQLDLFYVFGVTDLGIFECAKGTYTVVTDDGRLSSHLQGHGVEVLTLAQIRDPA